MSNKDTEAGVCSHCKSGDIAYGAISLGDADQINYPWTCNHCNANGLEWYRLVFIEQQLINKGNT